MCATSMRKVTLEHGLYIARCPSFRIATFVFSWWDREVGFEKYYYSSNFFGVSGGWVHTVTHTHTHTRTHVRVSHATSGHGSRAHLIRAPQPRRAQRPSCCVQMRLHRSVTATMLPQSPSGHLRGQPKALGSSCGDVRTMQHTAALSPRAR